MLNKKVAKIVHVLDVNAKIANVELKKNVANLKKENAVNETYD